MTGRTGEAVFASERRHGMREQWQGANHQNNISEPIFFMRHNLNLPSF
jgi:hypothetical protein